MRRGILVAAMCAIAAAAAGCAVTKVFPALLAPGKPWPAPQASATAPRQTEPLPAAASQPATVPAATQKPAPKPYDVVARHETQLPDGLAVELAYDAYAAPLDYFVALKSGRVYAKADTASKGLKSIAFGSRLRADRTVLGEDGKTHWVRVLWADKGGAREGYVKASAGRVRSFRLKAMLERAEALKETADAPGTVFIMNYKNGNGLPAPLPGGQDKDAWGYRRSQSAPAYAQPGDRSAIRYAPDGLLGRRLESWDGLTRVWFPTFGEALWVPDKYVSKPDDAVAALRQVIVVDRANQNAAVFDYGADGWKVVAMSYVSTGKEGGYSLKTPLGDFMAQGRYKHFYYYADGTTFIDGYAPWAIRFTGGGYLHGVPTKCGYDESGNRWNPEPAEGLYTLGTTPQSHMCVRNYTSFAKFLYDRFVKGQCAVIVLE